MVSAGQEHTEWGRAVCDQVVQVDPLNPLSWTQRAWYECGAGRLVEAEQAARRGLELCERGNPARLYAAYSLAMVGRDNEAIAVFDELAVTLDASPYRSLSAFLARALRGDAEGAVGHVTPLLEQSAHWVEYLAWFLADGYAHIGRRDEALRWLKEAIERGFINYPLLSNDRWLKSLHNDAGFEALMGQVHRRWQAFKL